MISSVKKLFYILPALILHLGAEANHNHSSTNILLVEMPNIKNIVLENITRSMISIYTTQKFNTYQEKLQFSSSVDQNSDVPLKTDSYTTKIKVTKPIVYTKTAKNNTYHSYSFNSQLPNVTKKLGSTSHFEIQTIVISNNTYNLLKIVKAQNVTELKSGRLKSITKTNNPSKTLNTAKNLQSKRSTISKTTTNSAEVKKEMITPKMEAEKSTKSYIDDVLIGATTVFPENKDIGHDIKRRQYPGQFQFPGNQFPLPGGPVQNGASQYQNNKYPGQFQFPGKPISFPDAQVQNGADKNNRYPASQFRNPGPPQPYQKDPKIERLLAEYRGVVKKFGQKTKPPVQQNYAQNGQYSGQYNQIPTPRRGRLRDYEDLPSRILPLMGAWGQQDSMGRQGPITLAPGAVPPAGFPAGDLPPGAGLPAITPSDAPGGGGSDPLGTTGDKPDNAAAGAATRFTTRITTTRRKRRTTPNRISLEEDCDYLAYYCLKAYDTGFVCGRTLFFNHLTFKNYCMLDYVNCMERYDIWQVAHMGECFDIKLLTEYLHYPYADDYFLDQYYIVEDM